LEHLVGVDWTDLFGFDTPVLEILVRGSIMYLGLFLLLRLVLKRESGAVGITDLLVVVLLADAAQNGMAADYSSIPDGILLVATIIFWSFALSWLGYRFRSIERLVHPRPLPLVKDGRMLRRNMRQELITEGELMSQLRLQGVGGVEDVVAAYMEGDGRISVIERDGKPHGAPERQMG
jgi:uncharacterized membrane protein YcaP (DUF421 family)